MSSCLSESHSFGDTFVDLAVVQNFAFTVILTITPIFKPGNRITQHGCKISPVSE